MERVWLALGSNLFEPLYQLEAAIKALACLPKTRLVTCSSYYRSKPLGPQNQPDFLNAVVVMDTALTPQCFLYHIQAIELRQGRIRKVHRWGPRTLDIDILLFGTRILNTTQLIIPHYDMFNRAFMLYPLAEVSLDLHLPDGNLLSDYLSIVSCNGLQFWDDTYQLDCR